MSGLESARLNYRLDQLVNNVGISIKYDRGHLTDRSCRNMSSSMSALQVTNEYSGTNDKLIRPNASVGPAVAPTRTISTRDESEEYRAGIALHPIPISAFH